MMPKIQNVPHLHLHTLLLPQSHAVKHRIKPLRLFPSAVPTFRLRLHFPKIFYKALSRLAFCLLSLPPNHAFRPRTHQLDLGAGLLAH